MEFEKKTIYSMLTKPLKVKFSIRLSILSIILILLVGVSVVIIGINYFAINAILVASAKNSLLQSSGKISEQIRGYLQPLNTNSMTARRMLKEGVAHPEKQDFTKFLFGVIADNQDLAGAYWGDVNGNLYWLNKNNGHFVEERIIRDGGQRVIKASQRNYSLSGKAISVAKPVVELVDPRIRPWYKQAKFAQELTWVVYKFAEIAGQKAQYGVTATFPIYEKGVFQGAFGIDMLLGEISGYVKNIKLTQNSFIFIVNAAGELITAYTTNDRHQNFLHQSNISNIDTFWVRESFELYKQGTRSPFIYSSGGKRYIAAYENIAGVKSTKQWYVGIVTPINDIVAPLKRTVFIGLIFVVITLLIGIVIASIFSSSISQPIKKLSSDAELICQLRLDSIKQLFSRIKEIHSMASAFIKMKNALYSFQRYMPKALVRNLIISNKVAAVGGEAKDLTLLFTDIQDFTSLSENFDPEQLMQCLSEYFEVITKVILDSHGTVDKYIGDGVMAFWGAPLDDFKREFHACQAALDIKLALQDLNKKWQSEGKPKLFTRFGISSGRVIVGNVGSDDRLSYTSLGDPVNLASRIEGLNKIYNTTIMVSEFVYEKVKDKFKFRFLDKVAVKGKSKGILVYELVGDLKSQTSFPWEGYDHEFHRAFSSYEYGDWEKALKLFEKLNIQHPDDKLISLFIVRCNYLIKNPPADWKGVWILDEK